MRAQRLIGKGVHGLPSGTPIEVYPVDVFEHPLSHWITGAGNYVIPVDSDWGLWFDFTNNDSMNTAVLPSVKGMNPITGRRTNGFVLERYEEKCPEHNEKFKDGNFCEKCDFKWPDQNYIAYPNTLWWDGFRTSDGKVRQFFFTEELSKSIPELVIGKEDTVPAFGFAFFRPKVERHRQVNMMRSIDCKGSLIKSKCLLTKSSYSNDSFTPGQPICDAGPVSVAYAAAACTDSFSSKLDENLGGPICSGIKKENVSYSFTNSLRKKTTSEVGVGAGAEIAQSLKVDPLKLDDWQTEPASVMRLYFIFIEQFEDLKEKGLRDLSGIKEGFLEGLPVG
jgi:hypothetical protein